MSGSSLPIPSKKHQAGAEAKPLGEWVLGEVITPDASQDPRWQGWIKVRQVEVGVTTQWARSKQG